MICEFCGYEFPDNPGRHGCPNCEGEGTMTKPENFKTAPRAVVRHDFAECATYRPALPGCVPLFALSIDGPLDAPENMPAGSMRASKYGPFGETFYRN